MSSHFIIILLIFNFYAFLTENVKALNQKERILSGLDWEIEEFSYLASVQAFGKYQCAAAIISDKHLLTIADCKVYPSDRYSVRVGSKYWSKDGLYIESIKAFIVHPRFYRSRSDFDYAVIVLKQPLTFSSTINLIPLPAIGEDVTGGAVARLAGWGTTNKTDMRMVSPSIKFVVIELLPRKDCSTRLDKVFSMSPRMICGVGFSQGQGPCYGDSGSPLVSDNILVGLVIWGYHCSSDYPTVYASVSEAIDFIEDVKNKSN